MVTKRRASGVLVALVIAGFLGACSSTKHPSASVSTSPPIKVGLICSCSGPFGTNILPAAHTYQSWVNTVNAAGGLEGHQVQLTVDDDAGIPGTSLSDAEALIAAHMDAIVDISIADQTWATKVQAAGIPVVGSNLSEVPFYTNPDFYPDGQTNDSVTYANVATAKTAGASNLGDLYCAEAAACAEGVPLIKAAGQALGVPVVYDGEISATATSYAAQCLAAKQDHVSALFIGDSAQIIAKVGKDCNLQGYTPIYVTEGEGFGMVEASSPGVRSNMWSEYPDIPFFATTAEVQAMNTAVNRYYPGLTSNGTAWTELAAQSWAAGLLLADAVKGGGLTSSATPSSSEIVSGLESLKGDTLDGMSPPLTFAAGRDHTVDCWFTARLSNGVTSVLNHNGTTCESSSSQ